MTVSTVKQVLQMDADSVVSAFKGRIKKIYDTKVGRGKRGAWSLQGLVCDEGGSELDLKLCNHDDIPQNWMGKSIYVTNDEGDSLKVTEYKGKMQLAVGDACTVTKAENMMNEPEHPRQQQAAQSRPVAAASPGVTPKLYLGICAETMSQCLRAAEYVVTSFKPKDEKSGCFIRPEGFESMALELYRSLERAGKKFTLPKKEALKPSQMEEPPNEPEPEPPVETAGTEPLDEDDPDFVPF